MERMKDMTRGLAFQALHWAVLYGAFVANMEGAMNALKFWVWLAALASLFLLSDRAVKDAATKPQRPPVQALLWVLRAWVTLGLLVWFGHIASAFAWGFVMAVNSLHQDAARKARTAAEQSHL